MRTIIESDYLEIVSADGKNQSFSKYHRDFLSVLLIFNTFFEFSYYEKNFGSFSTIESLIDMDKDFLFHHIRMILEIHLIDLIPIVHIYHPGIIVTNIQLYLHRDSSSNMISFFHLIYQSLVYDNIYSYNQYILILVSNNSYHD
jgi:hypothetical protein